MFTTLKPGEVVELQYLVYSLHSSLIAHALRHRDTHVRILSVLSQNERILTFNPAFALLL